MPNTRDTHHRIRPLYRLHTDPRNVEFDRRSHLGFLEGDWVWAFSDPQTCQLGQINTLCRDGETALVELARVSTVDARTNRRVPLIISIPLSRLAPAREPFPEMADSAYTLTAHGQRSQP